jgi:molybdopterin synthase catalytic subunit
MIRVQMEPFDVSAAMAALRLGKTSIGGTAIFVGSVRDYSEQDTVHSITLEHYPGMTEKALADIEQDARSRWPVDDVLIVHRYGTLYPGDDIVLVVVTSAHRDDAFQACQFLMDWLKTKAPFWKQEAGVSDSQWVEAKASDATAADRWNR